MTTPFTVVVPTLITDSNLLSISVPEDDYDPYDSSASYDTGNRCIVTDAGVHKIYESAVDDNEGNTPQSSPTEWLEVAPTNRWAAFDESGGTATTAMEQIEFEISADLIDSIAFLGLNAVQTIQVIASNDQEGDYYNRSMEISDLTALDSWYDYFFIEAVAQSNALFLDIPIVGNSTYRVIMSGAGEISYDTFIIGKKTPFGFTEYNARVGIIDYSKKDVDQFGKIDIVQRGYRETMDVSIRCDNNQINAYYQKLINLRSSKNLWIGADEEFQLLTVYGIYRDFSIDIAFANESFCSLQIEGLT